MRVTHITFGEYTQQQWQRISKILMNYAGGRGLVARTSTHPQHLAPFSSISNFAISRSRVISPEKKQAEGEVIIYVERRRRRHPKVKAPPGIFHQSFIFYIYLCVRPVSLELSALFKYKKWCAIATLRELLKDKTFCVASRPILINQIDANARPSS